jgi:predicted Zn finger-like uncharacterized protein
MILTCPQCATRYLLPAHTLAPEGRRVKCSSCKEVWFQLPDEEEIATTEQQKFEDIPQGVRPIPEGSNLPTISDEPEDEIVNPRQRFLGFAAAAVVCVGIFGALIAFQPQIISKHPFSRTFYTMIGYELPAIGSSLTFDALAAEAQPDSAGEKISITGKIVNPTEIEERVPMIEAQMHNEAGEILERWVIRPPAPTVAGTSDVAFSTDYLHATPGAAYKINLHFLPVEN